MFHVLALDTDIDDAAVVDTHPDEINGQSHRFQKDHSLADWFPADATYQMSHRYPFARRLCDLQCNPLRLLLVSSAFREILLRFECRNVEFFPITLLNHRGKVASTTHVVAHVFPSLDCIDEQQTQGTPSAFIPEIMQSISKLVLDERRIPDDVHIFRPKQMPVIHIVREPLARAIVEADLTGMIFVPVDQYDSAHFV